MDPQRFTCVHQSCRTKVCSQFAAAEGTDVAELIGRTQAWGGSVLWGWFLVWGVVTFWRGLEFPACWGICSDFTAEAGQVASVGASLMPRLTDKVLQQLSYASCLESPWLFSEALPMMAQCLLPL